VAKKNKKIDKEQQGSPARRERHAMLVRKCMFGLRCLWMENVCPVGPMKEEKEIKKKSRIKK
jgi:hypothetical protein